MAFTLLESDGTLNGTSYVDVVAAPASSTYRTLGVVNFYNADTAAVEITLALDNNGTVRVLYKTTVQSGDSFIYDAPINLDATTKKLKAKMTSAAATTNPDWVSSYSDKL